MLTEGNEPVISGLSAECHIKYKEITITTTKINVLILKRTHLKATQQEKVDQKQ